MLYIHVYKVQAESLRTFEETQNCNITKCAMLDKDSTFCEGKTWHQIG